MVSNSYFSLWNSLKLGFCLDHSTKPVFLKVFNNQHIAKSNGQFLVFILFDLSVAFDTFYKSVIEICSSLCYQDTIFLISYYLIGCSLVPGWFLPFSMIHNIGVTYSSVLVCLLFYTYIQSWWSHLVLMDQITIHIQELSSELQHRVSNHLLDISI